MTVQEAIDAGQDDIEHLSNWRLWRTCAGDADYRAERCRPFFETLARRGIWQTPTLVAASELATIGTPASELSAAQMAYAGKGIRRLWAVNQSLFATPEVVRRFRANAKVAAAVTSDMASAGVGILTGCDTMIAGFCVHDELAAMTRGGMTPADALRTATLNPARYFGIENSSGSVAPRHRADLVLLDANPLTAITNTRRIHAVFAAGRWLNRTDLDRLLALARAAAAKE